MDFSPFILVGVLVGGALLLIILWRAVRFMIRLALIGVLILLILAGALLWWFGSSGAASSYREDRRPSTAPRRAPAR